MFMLRSGMGKFLESLKSKFTGRKAAKGAKAKPSFRQWAKANGHEVGQHSIGRLMRQFIEATKPGKAGVRAAIAAEVATAISGKAPVAVDHEALDEATKVSAKAGSIEAVALRSALSMEPELPANLEADLDKVSALLDSGRQAEGLALLKGALAQIQTALPAAKDAPKSPTDAASASKASGSSLSASSKTVQPTHSKKAERAVDGAKLSAPSAKAATPAGQRPNTDGAESRPGLARTISAFRRQAGKAPRPEDVVTVATSGLTGLARTTAAFQNQKLKIA